MNAGKHAVFKNIWLVDDDLDDHLVFESAIKEVLPQASLTLFGRCTDLFTQLGIHRPDLLFLDINLTEINGITCLKSFRDIDFLQKIPVVMFTGSNYHVDIMSSYGFGATLYLIKPPSHQKLVNALNRLFELNWDDPQSITNRHFVGNRFVPFSTE
jgi:DNA-binding NtrC family response regulator